MPFISKRKLNALLTAEHTAGFDRGLAQGLALQDRDAGVDHAKLEEFYYAEKARKQREGGR